MSTVHPIQVLDRTDLLDFIKRLFPGHQTETWDGKQGQEFYRAVCAVWERVGFEVGQMSESTLILQATGPQNAVAQVDFTWTGGAPEAVTVETGQILLQTPWGEQYKLLEPLVFGAAGTTATALISSVWPTFWATLQDVELLNEWTVPSGVNPKDHVQWGPGVTDTSKDSFFDAITDGDLTFAVDGDFIVEGKIGTLDLIAQGRGLPRMLDETDEQLRRRIRNQQLTVTPAAIEEAVNQLLQPFGVVATLVFPWEYWFTIGDPDWGAIGDEDHPISRLAHFRVEFPNLQTDVDGFIIGDPTQGVIGDPLYGIGTGDLTVEALIASLNALLKKIKAAGVWAEAFELPL